MTKAEKHYKIAEMAVLGCHRSPKAITPEACAICQFNGDKCNQWQLAEKLVGANYQLIKWTAPETNRPTEYTVVWCHLKDGAYLYCSYFDQKFQVRNYNDDYVDVTDDIDAWTVLPSYNKD